MWLMDTMERPFVSAMTISTICMTTGPCLLSNLTAAHVQLNDRAESSFTLLKYSFRYIFEFRIKRRLFSATDYFRLNSQ